METLRTALPTEPGAYVLVLRVDRAGRVRIGRLGETALRRGWYLYVGSALGPGGLDARIRHHCRPAARPHWHIDYLKAAARLDRVWYARDARRWECAWADILARTPRVSVPIPGFGASDCACPAHLFFTQARPGLTEFRRSAREHHPDHPALRSLRPEVLLLR